METRNKEVPNEKIPRFWMKRSVLATFLCPPLGIIGVINSIKAEEYYHRNMMELAERRAEDARKWALWGICIFLFFALLTVCVSLLTLAFYLTLVD